MSIVTDALNRLQSARAHVVRPISVGSHDSPKPAEPTPAVEEGQKKATRDTKFLAVSVGSFLVVAAMALGAYWWGESVVELPTLKPRSLAQSRVTPRPLAEGTANSVASDQITPLTTENTIELASEEPSTDSQAMANEEVTVPSQAT